MPPFQWDRVKSIYLAAAELAPENRVAFVENACGGDEGLKAAVLRLLDEHDDDESREILTRRPVHTLSEGELLASRFRIVRFIGRGGMGEVYLAADTDLGGQVALKIVRPDLLSDPEFPSRFRREIQLARQVTHPNVCRIFDVGRDGSGAGERVFFTMEYLDGETLGEYLRHRRLSPEEALPLARQVAGGLGALHEKSIVHRDLKPGNVMVVASSTGPRAVIGDFGLARAVATGSTVQGLSESGMVAGTPDYMSPEQLLGKPVTPASDIYALGVLLYEMVTGAKPFRGGQALENAVQRMVEAPTPPSRHVPGLPAAWESTILRCLAREAADRPGSTSEVIGLLSGEISTPVAGTAPAKLPRWLPWAAVFSLLLVALFVLLPRLSWRPEQTAANQHVVVLPFKVLGDDPALRVFADGLMESLTSRISQYEGPNARLLVVPASEVRLQGARSASDARTKFGAGTAVEGSLQSQGDRVRLLLTLIDVKQMRQSGSVVVEERRVNAVSLQDAAVTRLANALNLSVQPRLARELAEVSPVAPGAHEFYLQARGYLQRTDQLSSIESAITLARRALELDGSYALAHSALGEALWYKYELTRDAKFVDEALRSGRRGVELNGGLPETNISMGRIHLGTGRHAEAQRDFEKALSIDDRNTEALQGLATAYSALKQPDKAEAAYRRAITLRPGDWTGYKQLGQHYYRQGNWDKAIEQYEQVIALTPDNAHGYSNMAVLQFRKGNFAAAKRFQIKTLELDPTRVSALSNLAKLHYEEGEHDRAIELYERALKLGNSSRSHFLWGSLGFACQRAGRTARAKEAFAQAVRIAENELKVNPNSVEVLQRLASYRVASGQTDTVIALLNRALELAPGNTLTLISVAETFASMGNEERAAGLARDAIAAGYPVNTLQRSVALRPLFERIVRQR